MKPLTEAARLEVIEIVVEELLAEQLAALPPERANGLAARLQRRAGYLLADPGFDPAERHGQDVAAGMDALLRAARHRALDSAHGRSAPASPRTAPREPVRRPIDRIEAGILD